jgi:hypothetical protein
MYYDMMGDIIMEASTGISHDNLSIPPRRCQRTLPEGEQWVAYSTGIILAIQ